MPVELFTNPVSKEGGGKPPHEDKGLGDQINIPTSKNTDSGQDVIIVRPNKVAVSIYDSGGDNGSNKPYFVVVDHFFGFKQVLGLVDVKGGEVVEVPQA